jgi:hypothetical protein
MIPELTIQDKLQMTLSQIRRYEKKRTKMLHNNAYYIQYYGYNVSLRDWSLECDKEGYIYANGNLENGNGWGTSAIVSLTTNEDHYEVLTKSNTIYRLYW